MPRIPEITQREQVPEGQRHLYDAIVGSRGSISGPYLYLLHCPELAARTAHMLGFSRFETDFPKDVKELAICAVARELDCVYEWAAHEDGAREAGVREEAILAIRDGTAPQGLTDEEAQIVKCAQELLRPPHRLTEPTFQALRSRLGDSRLVELTGTIGAYAALACTLNAYDVQAPAGRPVLPT